MNLGDECLSDIPRNVFALGTGFFGLGDGKTHAVAKRGKRERRSGSDTEICAAGNGNVHGHCEERERSDAQAGLPLCSRALFGQWFSSSAASCRSCCTSKAAACASLFAPLSVSESVYIYRERYVCIYITFKHIQYIKPRGKTARGPTCIITCSSSRRYLLPWGLCFFTVMRLSKKYAWPFHRPPTDGAHSE